MTKIIFYLLFTVIAGFGVYYGAKYFALPENERASFFSFVGTDIVTSVQRQEGIQLQVMNDAIKLIDLYFVSEEQYPDSLADIPDFEEPPQGMSLMYTKKENGYELRLFGDRNALLKGYRKVGGISEWFSDIK